MKTLAKKIEKILGVSAEHAAERLAELTPRETEIAGLLAEGQLPKKIAEDLGISPKTLDIHRANIKTKFGVKSTVHIVQFVLVKRLVEAVSKEAARLAKSN